MKIFYENRNCRENIFLSHNLTFNAHMHEEIEIVYMLEGTAHAFSGGVECILSPGDFFIAFPNHVHYYGNCQDNVAVVAIIPLKVLSELRGILTTKSPLSPHIKNADPLAGKLFESALLYTGNYKREAEKGLLLSAVSVLMEKVSFAGESNISYIGRNAFTYTTWYKKQGNELVTLDSPQLQPCSCGFSATRLSVVSTIDAIEAAF